MNPSDYVPGTPEYATAYALQLLEELVAAIALNDEKGTVVGALTRIALALEALDVTLGMG